MTQEQPIQVLEPERAPVTSNAPPRAGGGVRIALIMAALIIVAFGLGLLPDAAPTTDEVEGTLPAPAAATNVGDNDRLRVGVTSPTHVDTTHFIHFSLEAVQGLDGFTSFAGPAQGADGAWWMIGNQGTSAVVLRSIDGAEWQRESSLEAGPESFLHFGDLISADGQLVAMGYERISVNGVRINRLQSWRSVDGASWDKALIDDGTVFHDMRLVASGGTLVATFSLGSGSSRLYRALPSEPWGEVHLGLPSTRTVIRAPQGGFMVSDDDGDVLTSAYGVIWRRDGAIEPGLYSSWGDRAVGVPIDGAASIYVLDAERIRVIAVPNELAGCEFQGGISDLLAICRRRTQNRFDLWLSDDGRIWSHSATEMRTQHLLYEGTTQSGFLLSTPGSEGHRIMIRTARA